jgi:hypothetical protein
MGCGACRIINEKDEKRNTPLDWNLLKIPDDQNFMEISEIGLLNSYYKNAEIIIEVVEDFREIVFDKLDELIFKTGACVFSKPDIATCLKCVLWKISADNYGSINNSNILFLEDEPFIKIKDGEIKDDTKEIFNSLLEYISNLFSLKIKIKNVDLKIPELIFMLSEINQKFFMNNFISNKLPYVSSINDKNIIYHYIIKNNKKIMNTIEIFPNLLNVYNSNVDKINFEIEIIKKDSDYLINVDKVGKNAFSNNIDGVYEIAFSTKNLYLKRQINDVIIQYEDEDEDICSFINYISKMYAKSISSAKQLYENKLQLKTKLKINRKNGFLLNHSIN